MAGRVRVTIKDTGVKSVLTRASFSLSAGIHPDDAAQQHPADNGGRPLTIGELGEIHEHGAGHVPARSWLRGWFDENKDRALAEVRAALAPVVLKQLWSSDHVPGALQAAARNVRNGIVSRIAQHIAPPLAESTLAKKAPKIVPLIDSRALVDHISAQVESRGQTGDARGRRLNWDYAARAGKGGTK